jgi:hypothetical protein
MPTKLTSKPRIQKVKHYGNATGYNWVHDPFSDPLERVSLSVKNREYRATRIKKKKGK